MATPADSTIPFSRNDLAILRRDLRDLFEGYIPYREAIAMVGAADHPDRKTLRADWHRWTRAMEGC